MSQVDTSTSLSLSHYANLIVRRRILTPLFLLPFLPLCTPPTIVVIARALHSISGGYGMASLVSATLATLAAYRLIAIYAPSKEKYESAMDQCRYRLFVGFLLSALAAFRCLVHPVFVRLGFTVDGGDGVGDGAFFSESVAAVFMACGIRTSLGMLILSCVVALRFIGWFSLVQCSSTPLPSNPIDGAIKSLIATLSNPNAFLDMLVGPDPSTIAPIPHKSVSTSTFTYSSQPNIRLYKRPSIKQCSFQILIHAMAGGLLCHATILPFYEQYSSLATVHSGAADVFSSEHLTLLYSSCAIMSIATMFKTCLNNDLSHEICYRRRDDYDKSVFTDSRNFASEITKSLVNGFYSTIQSNGILPYCVSIPLFCLVGYWAVYGFGSEDTMGSVLLPLLLSYLTGFFLSIYLMLADFLVRKAVTVKGINIDEMLSKFPPPQPLENVRYDQSSQYFDEVAQFTPEDLIVESILAGLGLDVLGDIVASRLILGVNGCPIRNANHKSLSYLQVGVDVEEEEVQRNNYVVNIIADSMKFGYGFGAVTLEEDLLRVMIMESLGGGGCNIMEHTTNSESLDKRNVGQKLGLSNRHFSALQMRLFASDAAIQVKSEQPAIVPIVRALCAYAGGLGEALIRCIKEHELQWNPQNSLLNVAGTAGSTKWSLSPCASASAEYAILGAARLLVLNFTLPTISGHTRSRYNRLSLLVPVLLQSAFRLRYGILQYAQYIFAEIDGADSGLQRKDFHINASNKLQLRGAKSAKNLDNLGSFIAMRCPDLKHVLEACDNAAIIVMKVLTEIDGERDAKVKVHDDCRVWLNSML